MPMVADRGRPTETAWFTFSYGAARDDQGLSPAWHCGDGERAALIYGTVNVESTPDVGTTVYVRVPLGKAKR